MHSPKHICELKLDENNELHRNCCRRLRDAIFDSLLVSDMNPQTRLHFRSLPEIERERKRQKDYGAWVIHPYSAFRLYVELAMILVFFFHLIHTPWDMLFNVIYNEVLETPLFAILVVICTCGVLDMVMTFYTGYLDERTMEIVLDKAKIRRLYLRSWFLLFDIIATTPVEILVSKLRSYSIYYTRWLLLLCITRLCRIPTFVLYMNNAADLWHISRNVYKIARYTVFAMLIISWVGCMTAVVSMFAYMYHPECMHLNWVIQADMNHHIPAADLITAIVFRATSTLLGVKHGKFPNINPEDKICASISFFLGFFSMAFLLVFNLQMILDNSLADMSNYKFLSQLHHYMTTIRLPTQFRKKIVAFYKYRFRNNSLYDDDTMQMLSESLTREVKMFKYRSVIMKANIASELPLSTIQKMLDRVEEEYFMTGDCIVSYGQVGSAMYFIVTGSVVVYTHFGVEICHLYDGAYFGEVSLILEEKRIATAIALEPCEMCKLSRKDFFACVDKKSDVFRRLQQKAKARSRNVKVLNEMYITKMTRNEILGIPTDQSQHERERESRRMSYYPTSV